MSASATQSLAGVSRFPEIRRLGLVGKFLDLQKQRSREGREREEFRTGTMQTYQRWESLRGDLENAARNRDLENAQNFVRPVLQIPDLADSHLHALKIFRNLVAKEIQGRGETGTPVEIQLHDRGCRSWKLYEERESGGEARDTFVNERMVSYVTSPQFLEKEDQGRMDLNIVACGGGTGDFLTHSQYGTKEKLPPRIDFHLEIPLLLRIESPVQVSNFQDGIGRPSREDSVLRGLYPKSSYNGSNHPKQTTEAFRAWLDREPELELQPTHEEMDLIRQQGWSMGRIIAPEGQKIQQILRSSNRELRSLALENAKCQYLDLLAGFGVPQKDRGTNHRRVAGRRICVSGEDLLRQLDLQIQKAERRDRDAPRAGIQVLGGKKAKELNLVELGTMEGRSVSSTRAVSIISQNSQKTFQERETGQSLD